ncbi:DUF2148 domain-containing protein [Bacteroidales bacterium OttesenSCG-928-A17]|nr:DUF2148 domain-containing protein [Bacteroidales bacterium OttesenSCG-928-A17]
MIQNERDIRTDNVIEVAKKMMLAARTAPKAKGIDIIEVGLVTGESLKPLSEMMKKIGEYRSMKFFLRDAENILSAEAVVLIGTELETQGLNCFYCGYATCGEKPKRVPCVMNTTDIGIAIGSAVSVAADHRVDTRVMFSAGSAAMELKMLGDCKCVFAIPVSASSKNPFFDRKPKTEVTA